MNKIYEHIIKQNMEGKISRQVAAELISVLKKEEKKEVDIAVVGMALRTSLSDNIQEFWDNLKNGKDCIRPIPEKRKFFLDNYLYYQHSQSKKKDYVEPRYKDSAFLENVDCFDYEYFGFSSKEAQLINPSQRFFLEVAIEAIEDAGMSANIRGSNTGVYIGSTSSNVYSNILSEVESFSLEQFLPDSVTPSRLAYHLDLRGPGMVIDTSCSSSLVSVHLACLSIRNGDCDQAIAGGLNIKVIPSIFTERIYSLESEDGITRPFDNSSDGTNFGEGVAAIILKPLEKAIQDNDQIYAVIKGSAINQDGQSVGITAPNARAQEEVILSAWKNAQVDPKTISYIEAHGTATKLGDPIEVESINQAFRKYTDKKQFCAIGSVKSNIGHVAEASGIFGLIKASLALKHKEIPPSIHFKEPNKKIDWKKSSVYVNTRLSKWETTGKDIPLRCGVSSFGITGTNCHVVLEEAPPSVDMDKNTKNTGKIRSEIFTVSAKSLDVLKQLLEKYYNFLLADNKFDLESVCYTANVGREHFNHRLAIVARDTKDLLGKLKQLLKIKQDNLETSDMENIYYQKHIVLGPLEKKEVKEEVSRNKLKGLRDSVSKKIEKLLSQGVINTKLLGQIARLYAKGVDIDWKTLYQGRSIHKVNLPTYPFQKIRCWIDLPVVDTNFFHQNIWQEQARKPATLNNGVIPASPKGSILIFKNNSHKVDKIINDLSTKSRQEAIIVTIGRQFKKINENRYIINNTQDAYDELVKQIDDRSITQIIHALTMDDGKKIIINNIKKLDQSQELGVMGLFYLVKALQKSESEINVDIVLLSNNADRVVKTDKLVRPESATLFGLGKTVSLENRNIKCRTIDTDDNTRAELLAAEISSSYANYKTAYRNNIRFAEVLDVLDINKIESKKVAIKDKGAYVITGGTGGIGLVMAEYLSSKNPKVKLALINRTALPDRKEWNKIVAERKNKSLIKKLNSIKEIEARGATVLILSADVGEEKQIKSAIEKIRHKFGQINGVIHAAGVVGDGFIFGKNSNKFKSVLLPKVQGTWLLDYHTKNDNLDFFILFSSISAIFSAPGQGDYTAANSYLDAFSKYRKEHQRSKTKKISINWGVWSDVGMAVDYCVGNDNIFKAISNKKAVSIFGDILDKDIRNQNVIVGEVDYQHLIFNFDDYLFDELSFNVKNRIKMNRDQLVGNNIKDISSGKSVNLKGRKDGGEYTEKEKKIAQFWCDVLDRREINIRDNFFEMGGDSLKAIQVLARINKEFNTELNLKALFDKPTLVELARAVKEKSQNHINKTRIKKAKGIYIIK